LDEAVPEEAPSDMDEEVAYLEDYDDYEPPLEPLEPPNVDGLFAISYIVDQFEALLPDGYFITERQFLDDSNRLTLLSATNQPIYITETAGERLGRNFQQNAEILEVNGVQVFLNSPAEGGYQLHFVVMNSIFAIEGSDARELIAVVRAVINVPELIGGYGIGDGITEEIETIRLPGGLIFIIPLP
jgi:hypothetical protein